MYTGRSAIDQRGSGLLALSILFCGVVSDMILMNDFHYLK